MSRQQCNFPWEGAKEIDFEAEELQVDRVASLIKPGEKVDNTLYWSMRVQVRVKSSVEEPGFGWGDIGGCILMI